VDAFAVEAHDDLAVLEHLALVDARVPDVDFTGAVAARGDRALETQVLERVVLGPRRRQVLLLRLREPRGNAHEASTPPCSRRKSQCSRRAWCSWMTKRREAAAERPLPAPACRRTLRGRQAGDGAITRHPANPRRCNIDFAA